MKNIYHTKESSRDVGRLQHKYMIYEYENKNRKKVVQSNELFTENELE